MARPIDKGLSSSMWASPGRSYRFNKTTTTTTQTQTSAYAIPRPARAPQGYSASPVSNATSTVNHQIDFQSALARVPTPWAELARYTKIVRRLKWKLPLLAYGYNAATDVSFTLEQRAESELMFKIDWFEFYMLIERALVHLLGVFGIKITGALSRATSTPRHEGWQQSDHRFHANVLEALDDYRNPLYEALGGTGDARSSLARAKELRNRWKNADEPDAMLAAKLPNGYRNTRPLEEYDLERTLEAIFAGFDRAFGIAEQYVAQVQAVAAERGVSHNVDMDQPDEWQFMTDAMDWEAV